MRFPGEKNYEDITEAVARYCSNVLIPVVAGKQYTINCIHSESMEFNAGVSTSDGKEFTILFNYGITETFIDVINRMDDKDIEAEIEELSEKIYNNRTSKNDIYRGIVFGAVFFVMLHELAHILKQHLHYVIKSEAKDPQFYFNEIDIGLNVRNPLISEAFFNDNILKLFELDADASSVILLLTLSIEIFGETSELYDTVYPGWKEAPENEKHRKACNEIMLYGACLALAAIEAKRGVSEEYPSPFTRIINIYDAFNQEIYKAASVIDPGSFVDDILYLENNEKVQQVMSSIIFPVFLNSVDIIITACLLLDYDLKKKYNLEELAIADSLLKDFVKLLKELEPGDLQTKEAEEYKVLRIYRPRFNKLFTQFLSN